MIENKNKALILVIHRRDTLKSRQIRYRHKHVTRIVHDIELVEKQFYPPNPDTFERRWAEGRTWKLWKGKVRFDKEWISVYGWTLDLPGLPLYWVGKTISDPMITCSEQCAYQWLYQCDAGGFFVNPKTLTVVHLIRKYLKIDVSRDIAFGRCPECFWYTDEFDCHECDSFGEDGREPCSLCGGTKVTTECRKCGWYDSGGWCDESLE